MAGPYRAHSSGECARQGVVGSVTMSAPPLERTDSVEKLDLLVWESAALAAAEVLEVSGLRALAVSRAADLADPPLLLGRGADLAGLVELWLDSVDVWRDVIAQVPGDAYLVTESVPQPPANGPGLLTHLSWFPKPARLTEEEFFHGWHDVHTPSSARLHPLRQGYVRDSVARRLSTDSAPVRAIVSEFFHEADYMDPSRLFGSDEELVASMDELPMFADQSDISSCPVWRMVVKS
jgi:EthD domain